MYIDFTGRQVEISPDLRRYTQERLQKNRLACWAKSLVCTSS